jgi:hypothetical protein
MHTRIVQALLPWSQVQQAGHYESDGNMCCADAKHTVSVGYGQWIQRGSDNYLNKKRRKVHAFTHCLRSWRRSLTLSLFFTFTIIFSNNPDAIVENCKTIHSFMDHVHLVSKTTAPTVLSNIGLVLEDKSSKHGFVIATLYFEYATSQLMTGSYEVEKRMTPRTLNFFVHEHRQNNT